MARPITLQTSFQKRLANMAKKRRWVLRNNEKLTFEERIIKYTAYIESLRTRERIEKGKAYPPEYDEYFDKELQHCVNYAENR